MSDERIEGKWIKDPQGRQERSTLFPTGMLRKERRNFQIGGIRLADKFTNASRRLTVFPTSDDPKTKKFQDLLKQSSKPEIYFLSEDATALERIRIQDGTNITVLVKKSNTASIDNPDIFEGDSNVILGYQKGSSVRTKLRAEVVWLENPVLSVRQALPILVETIGSLDEDIRATSKAVVEQELQSKITSIGENSPRVQASWRESISLSTASLQQCYNPDLIKGVKEGKTLEEIGFRMHLQNALLTYLDSFKTDDVGEALKNVGGAHAFVTEVLLNLIREFSEEGNLLAGRSLEVQNFRDDTFVDKTGAIHPYDEEVAVQDHKFKFAKQGNSVSVVCSSNTGIIKWKLGFPLTLPDEDFDFIINRGSDPDPSKDFREIKPKLQLEFEGTNY